MTINTSVCKTERKREQNRIAQQLYRRNQKRKLLELEAAVAAQSAITCSVIHIPEDKTAPVLSQEQDETVQLELDTPGLYCDDGAQWSGEAVVDSMHCSTPQSLRTPNALHRAVSFGSLSMTKLLLEHGACVSTMDSLGNTALHLAAERGLEDIVKLLLDQDMDPNAVNMAGQTALFSAVNAQNENVVRMIIEASVDVNIRDFNGVVALYMAVERNSEPIVTLLLSNGADIDA
ncbi:ankyrin repeat-containing domain protein [Trichoderma sp. SZMC 28014]